MKRWFTLFILTLAVLATWLWAQVQVQNEYAKYFRIKATAGQRILILDSKAVATIRISSGRIFDYKVPDKKTISGMLIEK